MNKHFSRANLNLQKKTLIKAILLGASVIVSSFAFVPSGQAHHPVAAKFDPSKEKSLMGVVSFVDWSNPHAHIFLNVTNSDGKVQNWAVELESPVLLKKAGWSENALKPGDHVNVTGILARNGTRQLWSEKLTLTGTGRQVFTMKDIAPRPLLNQRPTPRWPDGRVALGGTNTSIDGYWSFPSAMVLTEDGSNVQADDYGQLNSVTDAAKVAPFQDWALALFKHRQERMLQDDPMYLHCKPPGGPRQFQSNLGIKLLEDRPGDRVFVLMGGGNHNYRIIYLDGREQSGQVTGDDDNPLYFGRSVGYWEDDVLVVNTTDFNEDFWMSNGGLPHTSQLVLNERFSRPDLDTLHYEVTIEDLGAYTRNWKASWDLRWVGGEELPVHFCQDNRP
jgi:hypothetical protein